MVAHGTPRSTEIHKKMPWFGTHIFSLCINTPGITKIPKMKLFHVYQNEILYFYDLCTEKWSQNTQKEAFSSTKMLMELLCKS